MKFLTFKAIFSFLILLTATSLAVAQTVTPFSTHDCSSQVYYSGDTACNGDRTTCCAATGACCAGGCCPYNAICVFKGTANEACCPLSDKTECGAAPPPSTHTCPPLGAPSVPCSGIKSNWYCAPGCSCDVSMDKGCNCFTGCTPGGGSGASGSSSVEVVSSATPTSTSDPAAAASSQASSQTQSSAASVQTVSSSPAAVGASGSSTATVAAAATTTTKASNAGQLVKTISGVGMVVAVLGFVIVY